jgi:aminoglycoside phosphotransferase family enzyme/predicted kinase
MDDKEPSDQSEVFAFLADPATHHLSTPVTRINTHGASVFLAGAHAYKVKRAVKFPFMDFSTLEKRRLACENEIAVNRANAPELYLGTIPISRDGGALKLGPGPDIVEWAVHLTRFDETRTLDKLDARGALDLDLAGLLGTIVAEAHRKAPVAKGKETTKALRGQMEETLDAFAHAPESFDPALVAELKRRLTHAFALVEPLLLKREAEGQARRCHGDLHLGNIVLIGSEPVLFDAIEFDDQIATSDRLYDLAFLLMDLWTRGRINHANLVLNRYLWASAEIESNIIGLAALPMFLSLRAAIRAKVINLRADKTTDDLAALSTHFDMALHFLDQGRLDLVAIGGLSGSGKSTLAGLLAPMIGRAPGAVHLRSDIERKRLFGIGEFERLPSEAYSFEHTAATFNQLRRLAALALTAGQSVVVDAVHRNESERAAIQHVAAEAGAHFTGLWLEAPLDELRARVARRTRDASDATEDVVVAQAAALLGEMTWARLDASGGLRALSEAALGRIG